MPFHALFNNNTTLRTYADLDCNRMCTMTFFGVWDDASHTTRLKGDVCCCDEWTKRSRTIRQQAVDKDVFGCINQAIAG